MDGQTTAQQRKLYIGMDLGGQYTQISYFCEGMEEPETVSLVAGEERYRILTALWKPGESEPWYLTDSEPEDSEKDMGLWADDLLERSLRGEKMTLENECEASELLLLFLRKVIRLIPDSGSFSRITAITIHLEGMYRQQVEFLQGLLEQTGIPRERIFFQDSLESFCHFAMNQKRELMLHDVVLFSCWEDRLIGVRLYKEGSTIPQKVKMEKAELGELPKEPQERDRRFGALADQMLRGRLVSAVYLTGDGLEGGWMKDSLNILCRGRKAFQGRNLMSKGACYGSYMQMHREERSYIYFSDYRLKDNIFIQVKNARKTWFYELAEAGCSYYEVYGCCEALLSGEACVDVWRKAPDSNEARIESLELTDLPQRPDKATRLLIELLPMEKGKLRIRVTDLGFGAWYKSSGKVWEYRING